MLSKISPLNQSVVRSYISSKRAQGLRVASLVGIGHVLVHADRNLHPTPVDKASPTDVTNHLELYSRTHDAQSTVGHANLLKGFYKWVHGGELPRAYREALRRIRRAEMKDIQPISRDEFDALLRAAEANDVHGPKFAIRTLALLWTLWDSGFRVSELLALRVGSVEPVPEGGMRLRLPHDAPDLKTGPRTILVVEAEGAIRAWLAQHPFKDDPGAPLWLSSRDLPLHLSSVGAIVKQLEKKAGFPKSRHIHPHLFRHTRATRAAEAGWNEPHMRAYFGWHRSSTMPSHYVHLAQRKIEDRVRAEAELNPLLERIRADPKAALKEAVTESAVVASADMARRLLEGLGLGAANKAPSRDERR